MDLLRINDETVFCLNRLETQLLDMFLLEPSGHDMSHLRRTLNMALHIQECEGGDRFLIALAAFLHDVHRVIQNQTRKYCPPVESLPRINDMLLAAGVRRDVIPSILFCIEHHEEYDFSEVGKTTKDIETSIVQDADNLDAIGAIGSARVFSFGGAHNIPIWVPEIPLDRESPWDETKPKSPSQIQHFYEKLLRLKDDMNTETAKQIALGRHQFMELFLDRFFREWKGEV